MKSLRERCKSLAASQIGLGFDDATDELEAFALQIRNEALEEAKDRVRQYRQLDKYGSRQEGAYFLLNAEGLIEALKTDALAAVAPKEKTNV